MFIVSEERPGVFSLLRSRVPVCMQMNGMLNGWSEAAAHEVG